MKNKYILLEMNQHTSIPILRFGISSAKARQMKQRDCDDNRIRKEILFGVNDSKGKHYMDKEKFKTGKQSKCKIKLEIRNDVMHIISLLTHFVGVDIIIWNR